MNVLHVNTTSHTGGAARAMQRLHKALKVQNHGSQLLVSKSKYPDDSEVHIIWEVVEGHRSFPRSVLSRIGNLLEQNIGIHPWANRPNRYLANTSLIQWADIIDLRNLFGGYFNLWSLPALSKAKPVFWRLPDLWALTGHCAYPYECQRWMSGCFDCPLLVGEGRQRVEPPPLRFDNTKRIWNAKRKIYQRSDLHIIVNSQWMKSQVEKSILSDALSITYISNGVDLNIFKPIDRSQARHQLGLPQDQRTILWAAGEKGNYRKGYQIVLDALRHIQTAGGQTPLLITMAADQGWDKPEEIKNIYHFGYVRDPEKQARIYSAADVFACSTLADAQPQTVLESLACGTPVIAFDIGPLPDIVLEGRTGVIAPDVSSGALAAVIRNILVNEDRLTGLRESCRAYAERHFDIRIQTDKYISLYEDVLKENRGGD